MGRVGVGESGRVGDGEIGRWGDGESACGVQSLLCCFVLELDKTRQALNSTSWRPLLFDVFAAQFVFDEGLNDLCHRVIAFKA